MKLYKLTGLILAGILMAFACLPLTASAQENMMIAGVDLGYPDLGQWYDTDQTIALLGSVQCMAFARYCQQKVYGANDFKNPSLFTDIVGKRKPSECTPENLRKWFMGCAPATHVRCPGDVKSMHSMAIAETSEDGVHMIHGNWYKYNICSETYWSWEKFSDQMVARGGILFAMSYTAAIGKRSEPEEIDAEKDRAPGDVNADGKITTADARLSLRASTKIVTLPEKAFAAADLDGNGRVTSGEARMLLRVSARLTTLDGELI